MKLSTLSFALLTAASYINLGSAQENVLDLVQTFREPKNILFSVNMGGSSHVLWVLSILEELAARGHHAKLFTRDDHIRFAKKFPSVKPISSGPSVFTKEEYVSLMPELIAMEPVAQAVYLIENFSFNYTEEYYKHRDIFNTEKVDLAVCDSFTMACSDAAEAAGLPFVVTSSMALSPDTAAPYINANVFNMHHPISKGVSFFTRLNDKVISPLRFTYGLRHTISKTNQGKKSIGLKVTMDPMDVWKDSIKIVNNAFGFEAPRPVGPQVELIGPIVPLNHAGLNSELQTFLDHRRKVVYVAFGQISIPTRNEVKMILTAMLENMETDAIDGIIWSTRGIEELFPEYITTRSNTTYDIRSLFKSSSAPNETNIAFVNWAPQVAILHHPSTALFLTHGGAGSLHESLYNGVPVVVFPCFGDQPAAAVMAEENGYGRYLKSSSSQEQTTALIADIILDQDGSYRQTVRRFQSLVQIRAHRGVQRGADLMEETLFANKDGKMVHRRDVKEDLSTIVAYNLDIYAFIALLIFGSVSGLYRGVIYITHHLQTLPSTKLKSA